jgi:hypothetical protein
MNTGLLRLLPFLAVVFQFGSGRLSAQVVLGQVDDFQDGTVQNWDQGPFAGGPMNIATGGPAGAGDRFMQIFTNGGSGGANSHMVVYNRAQWLGNYIGQGINAIEMDLENFGPQTLHMRLGFRGALPNFSPGYVSTFAFTLPADSAWHHATFLIDSANMTNVGAASAYSTFFANGIAEFRLLNLAALAGTPADLDGSTTFPNPMMLGIDNIHAIAVPEPSSLFLSLLAIVGVAAQRSRRRKRQTAGAASVTVL